MEVRALQIDLQNVENPYHQSFLINEIEIKLDYNYLIDRFFIDISANSDYIASNIPVLPNENLLEGFKYPDEDQDLGVLVFKSDDAIINKENFEKVEVYYIEDL